MFQKFIVSTAASCFLVPSDYLWTFHPVLSDHEKFPYLHQMASDHTSLALALVSFIIHFGWNWVGLVISDNDQGIQFLSYLRREMEKIHSALLLST